MSEILCHQILLNVLRCTAKCECAVSVDMCISLGIDDNQCDAEIRKHVLYFYMNVKGGRVGVPKLKCNLHFLIFYHVWLKNPDFFRFFYILLMKATLLLYFPSLIYLFIPPNNYLN